VGEAKQTLVRSLELAQPQDYRRAFLDEGESLTALLGSVLYDLEEGPIAQFVRALLYAQAHGTRGENLQPSGSIPSVEPLSEQEQRVLRLLSQGLSNPEIAEELVISLNTVKSHVKSIYRKLNVRGRKEARQAARQLNII
jgi:LuxR family maltose regulon positive regulatory protein